MVPSLTCLFSTLDEGPASLARDGAPLEDKHGMAMRHHPALRSSDPFEAMQSFPTFVVSRLGGEYEKAAFDYISGNLSDSSLSEAKAQILESLTVEYMDSWGWDKAEEAALVNLRAIERRNGGSGEGEAGTGAEGGTREGGVAVLKVGTQNQEETGSKSTREGMREKEEKGGAHHEDGGHDGGPALHSFPPLARLLSPCLHSCPRTLPSRRHWTHALEVLRQLGCDMGAYREAVDCLCRHVRGEGGKRRPRLIMMGGGMGAGKSTVRRRVLEAAFTDDEREDVVQVEADHFKTLDPVYRRLTQQALEDARAAVAGAGEGEGKGGHQRGALLASQHVHAYSTQVAEELLLWAVWGRRHILLDSTLTWQPFVAQTIAMARDTAHRYRRGPGYVEHADGSISEAYWQIIDQHKIEENGPHKIEENGRDADTDDGPCGLCAADAWDDLPQGHGNRQAGTQDMVDGMPACASAVVEGDCQGAGSGVEGTGDGTMDGNAPPIHIPPQPSTARTKQEGEEEGEEEEGGYIVELVGVCVNVASAMARAWVRRIGRGRGVGHRDLLRSHRLFAQNFQALWPKFDAVSLYDNSGAHPCLIAHRPRGAKGGLTILDQAAYDRFLGMQRLNQDARRSDELYT